ncbi:MAG: hypothetical protein M3Z02_06860 [Actinomycetota bacterium]|nr:hypothetical protein [Actinomycetota bacterium]
MRVYLPSTLPALRLVLVAGEVGPAPVAAFAVTPALREWYATGDAEELEYAALAEAARASLRLLDLDPSAPRRRLVLAAEVAESGVRPAPERDRALVLLAQPVPLARVVSAHVDDAAAEPAVAAAADAVVAADLGSDDAQFALDEAEGHELLWYAAQELALLDL